MNKVPTPHFAWCQKLQLWLPVNLSRSNLLKAKSSNNYVTKRAIRAYLRTILKDQAAMGQEKMKKKNVVKRVRILEPMEIPTPPPSPVERMDLEKKQAVELVNHIIASAIMIVEETEGPVKNIQWITHGDFTAERGRKQIEKFIMTWEYQDRWVHYTEFLKREDRIHSFYYIYCVHWSPATARLPMSRVSAAAFFTIKFTKNKPPDLPVDVSYTFEGHSLIQRPGMIRFREQWLREIVESKHILMESIPF